MKLKKWVSLALCAVLVLGMSGCVGNLYEKAATVDGTEISSGLYLMIQYTAYNEARYKVENSQGDVLSQKVEDQKAQSWINTRTEELMRRYVAVRRLAREKGLAMDATGEENMNQMMQYWSYLEEVYADNGISQSTMVRYMTMEELSRQLFFSLYEEGGELYTPDDELKAEYGENYRHLRMISIPINALDETVDVRDEVLAQVDGLVEELEAGKTLEEVADEDIEPLYELMGRTSWDPEKAQDSIFDSYIDYQPENYDTYTEEFLHYLKGLDVGDYGAYNMGSTVILYEVIPTFASQEEFDSYRNTVLEQLKTDEYEDYLRGIYQDYPVSWVFGARWYMRPTKIVA